jgi:hypothetical protein
MVADLATATALAPTDKQRGIAVLWSGANDIDVDPSKTPEDIYALQKTWWAAMRAAGFEIVAVCGDRIQGGSSSATNRQNNDRLNALIRSDITLYDYRVDVDRLLDFGFDPADYMDNIHPSASGNTKIVREFLRTVFQQTVGYSGRRVAASREDREVAAIAGVPGAQRGGVFFEQRTDSRSSALSQEINTEPFSLYVQAEIPAANPSAVMGIIGIGPSVTDVTTVNGPAVRLELLTSGKLRVGMSDGSGNQIYADTTDSVVSLMGGYKRICDITVAFDRVLDRPRLWLNSTEINLTTPVATGGVTFAQSITATYLVLGHTSGSTPYGGVVKAASVYNYALTYADVREIASLNGGLTGLNAGASQTAITLSTWTGSSVSAASSTAFTMTAAGGGESATADGTLPYEVQEGERYRASFNVVVSSGSIAGSSVGLSFPSGPGYAAGLAVANGQNHLILTMTPSRPYTPVRVAISGNSGAVTYGLSGFRLVKCGAIAHYSADSAGASVWINTVDPSRPIAFAAVGVRPLNNTITESVQDSSPTTGQTVTVSAVKASSMNYITPAGTLAALTLALPSSVNAQRGMICRFFITQIITSLTVNTTGGGTIIGTAPDTSAVNSSFAYECVSTAGAGTWVMIYPQ